MQISFPVVRTALHSLLLASVTLPLGGFATYAQQAPPKPLGPVAALVVMTPTGPATCNTGCSGADPVPTQQIRPPSSIGRRAIFLGSPQEAVMM